jgi:hypothetical protein
MSPPNEVFDPTLPQKIIPDPSVPSEAVVEMRERASGRIERP